MSKVLPFDAFRPDASLVSDVAALPYDVYKRAEAKAKRDAQQAQVKAKQDALNKEVTETKNAFKRLFTWDWN